MLTWNADLAAGLPGLLGNKKAIGESLPITSEAVLTSNQIFQELYSAIGVEPNIIHVPSDLIVAHAATWTGTLIGDKINSSVFDDSKIKRFVPDFNCKVKWSEGLGRALKWFEADPARQSIDNEMNVAWDKIISAYEKVFP